MVRASSGEDCDAWSSRPYGCIDLSDACKLFEARRIREKQEMSGVVLLDLQKPVASYPEWCYRHEHPLKTGVSGKIYHRSDVIGPVVDSLRGLHDRSTDDAFGLCAYIASKKRKITIADKPLNSGNTEDNKGHATCAPIHAWTCRGCGNHDRTKLQLNHDGYTCSCGAWAGTQIIGANRQKLGALEQEDKTVTADRPWESKTDRYDRGPETAKEARVARLARAKTGNGLGGRRAGMHMGRLCDVQALTDRDAAKSIIDMEVAAGIALNPRDRVKQRAVLSAVEDIFKMLYPVDHPVKRAVRMTADKTYIAAVQHCCRCSRSDICEVRLADRHATAIAHAVFEHTIGRICETGMFGEERFDLVRLNDLRDRMTRSVSFHGCSSATQLASSKIMVELINAPDFDFTKQCEPCDADMPVMPHKLTSIASEPLSSPGRGIKCPVSLRPLHSPCLAINRSLSICSNGENSPTPSKQIEWRNAISSIFIAHRAELQTCVRESAMRVIQLPSFISACETDSIISKLNNNQLAFCLLNAVAMEQSSSDSASFAQSRRPNAGIAEKIELGLLVADEAIGCMRAAIPAETASDQSERDADDLFN